MTVANPVGLWLLSAAAPLVALYLYRIRPKLLRVPYLTLWAESVAEERRWGGPRVREMVSLALLLGVIGALGLALAGTEIPALAHAPRTYVVLLDGSASMEAREPDGRSRAAAAQAFIDTLRSRLYYNDTLRVMRSPGDHFAPFVEALDPPDGTVIVLSDHSEPCRSVGRRVTLATDRPNAGFTHAVLGRAPEERWYTGRIRVRNFHAAPAALRVEWRLDGAVARAEPVALAAGQERELSHTFEKALDGGELAIVLTPADAYAADDVIRMRLPPARPVGVAVYHEGSVNPFLMSALELLRDAGEIDAGLSLVEKVEEFAAPGDRVVIFDGAQVDLTLPAGRYLLLGTSGPVPLGDPMANPPVVSSSAAHPINRFLDFSSLHVKSARAVGAGEPLIETEGAAIGAAWREGGRALVALGFRLQDSDFALMPAFPIFLRNALRWLADPPPAPATFDPIESDIAPKAEGETAEAVLPEPPTRWKNVPHAVLLAVLAAGLLGAEVLLRKLSHG